MSTLPELIAAYEAAKAAFDAADEADDDLECEAYNAAEHAVIIHPCQTIDEIRLKARFFLDNGGPNDTLCSCYTRSGPVLDLFLRSLLGEVQEL